MTVLSPPSRAQSAPASCAAPWVGAWVIVLALASVVGGQESRPGGAEPLPKPRTMRADADKSTWTLAQVESVALERNPTLSQLQAQIEAARGRWIQAGLPPNPSIGYSGQQIGDHGRTEQDGATIQMEIVRLTKLRLSRSVVSEEIAMAEQKLLAQELRVLTDARIGFYDVLAAQRRVQVQEELLRIGRESVQAAERLLNAKEVSRFDLLQARVESEQARIQLDNARQRSQAAWRSLAASLGSSQLDERTLLGDLEDCPYDFEWESSLDRLLGASPEVAVAATNIQRARQALARAQVETKPNLQVQGIVQRDNGARATNGALQFMLPIPVLNRNQGAIRAAEREVFAAEQNLRRTELDLQRRLAAVFERYAVARRQAEHYVAEIIPNAKESLELAQAAYRAGELGYIPLLTAQRTFSQTNLTYLEALRELWAASLEIEGLLLTGSLDEPQ